MFIVMNKTEIPKVFVSRNSKKNQRAWRSSRASSRYADALNNLFGPCLIQTHLLALMTTNINEIFTATTIGSGELERDIRLLYHTKFRLI